jgi:hypothetical protein
MITNVLRNYIYKETWAPVSYHISDDEGRDGIETSISFIHLTRLIAREDFTE